MCDDAWMHHMRRGEFDKAWLASDEVLRRRSGVGCHDLPRHFQWIWSGRPLEDQHVLVRCYHGLGDTIQFVRYMPLLKSIAAKVTVWMQPTLIPLLGGFPGIDRILALHDGRPDCDYDVDLEIMELPHVFRTTLDTIPRDVPYLNVEAAPLPDRDHFAVGIFPNTGDWDSRRAVPWERFTTLAAAAGVRPYVLARDALSSSPSFHSSAASDQFHILTGPDDIVSTAQLMRAFDLVIAVDSMPAHLAGALGVPTWTLLHADADWRWMEGRTDSPWYPTMRLFRQKAQGGWGPVIAEVVDALRTAISRSRDSTPLGRALTSPSPHHSPAAREAARPRRSRQC
jgi:hypothetical protein